MFFRHLVLVFFVLSFQMCSLQVSGQEKGASNITHPTKASIDTANQPDPYWRERSENRVYSAILEKIFYASAPFGNGAFDKLRGYDWLCVRRRSIGPADFEKLSGNPKVSADIIEDLRAVNKTPSDLSDEYDVHAAVKAIYGSRDLEKLFSRAKRKYPHTKALVGLSRMGFNADRTLGLVYVEYYSEEKKKLEKVYCMIPMKTYRVKGERWDRMDWDRDKIEIVEF